MIKKSCQNKVKDILHKQLELLDKLQDALKAYNNNVAELGKCLTPDTRELGTAHTYLKLVFGDQEHGYTIVGLVRGKKK